MTNTDFESDLSARLTTLAELGRPERRPDLGELEALTLAADPSPTFSASRHWWAAAAVVAVMALALGVVVNAHSGPTNTDVVTPPETSQPVETTEPVDTTLPVETSTTSTTTTVTEPPEDPPVVSAPRGSLADGTYVATWGALADGGILIELGEDEHLVQFEPGIMFGLPEADEAAIEDGYVDGPGQLPNPYYIRDLGYGPITLPVSAEVVPRALTLEVTGMVDTTWEDLARVYAGSFGGVDDFPRWWPIEVVVVDDEIVEFTQIYLP